MQRLLNRMVDDHSFLVGFTIAVPTWLFSETPTIDHAVMIGILIFVFGLDWLTGTTLARRSPVCKRTSHQGNESLIRDFIIVLICVCSAFLDFLFETKSFIFAFFTGAFIWQNFYSFLGNIAALVWSNHFPMWLFNLVEDEMLAKLHKYFPHEKGKDDKND